MLFRFGKIALAKINFAELVLRVAGFLGASVFVGDFFEIGLGAGSVALLLFVLGLAIGLIGSFVGRAFARFCSA